MSKIIVSRKVIDIFLTFDKMVRVDDIKELSEKELYILLLMAIDSFSDTDKYVVHNITPFEEEVVQIFNIQNGLAPNNETLLEMVEESGSFFISTDSFVDEDGDRIPDLLNKSSVRKHKIKILNND